MSSNDFALAQQRIAARRQARESQARAALEARKANSEIEQRLAKLPGPVSTIGRAGISIWDSIKGREGTGAAFRVGQVDAELLDEELLSLLKGQVGEGLKYYGGHLQDDYGDEIMLGLRAILFKLTVWDHDATYGAALQNLKFTDARHKGAVLKAPSKAQKLLYGLLTVFGSYGWARWESHISSVDSSYDEPTPLMRRLSTLTTKLSTLYSSAALASFLVFLVNGRYRTLLDRILRLRLAPPTSQVSREVSFEYLNRQLVWHAFTEFLLFLLPLVGISRWRRWLSRAWRKTKSMLTSDPNVELTGEKMGELAFLPERTCAICYQESNSAKSEAEIIAASASAVGSGDTDVTNPYECIPCGDVYCFVCIASKLESEGGEGWVCLRCGEVVKECKPWSGDVIEEQPKRESSKSVGFQDDVKAEEEEEAASEEEDYDEDGEHDERGEYEDDDEGSESEAYEEDEDMEDGPDFDE